MKIYINGKLSDSIKITDRGFQFGDGLFETMVIHNGIVKDLDLHLSRMSSGAKRLGISFPVNWEEEIISICKSVTHSVLKLILTRGNSDLGLKLNLNNSPNRIIKISSFPAIIDKFQNDGIKMQICKIKMSCNPSFTGLKLLNWLEPAMANLDLSDGYQEGLMLDMKGNIVEGTTSNFFAIKNNTLFTPDLTHCGLSGITRDKILAIAKQMSMQVNVTNITVADLANFDECFISNSVINIYPVLRIENTKFKIDRARLFQDKLKYN